MIKNITLAEAEFVAHDLATRYLKWNEPIPSFDTRFPNILESCLLVPFQTFNKRPLYHGLTGKAAMLFYLMIKNHPFQNGNKRIAMTTVFYFLYKNKKWIRVDEQELYNVTLWVASSPPRLKHETVVAIKKFIDSYLVNL